MCWHTIVKEFSTRHIAKKDIKAFKVVAISETGRMKSIYYNHEYIVGAVYQESLQEPNAPNASENLISNFPYPMYFIHNGLHSYVKDKVELYKADGFIYVKISNETRNAVGKIYNETNYDSGLSDLLDYFKRDAVYYILDYFKRDAVYYKLNCVIPKGSEYYENEFGEIVSNKLQVVSQEII